MSVGLLSGGAFVQAPYYLVDAFSIIPNNYIYIYIYTYIYIYIHIYIYIYTCGQVCVCACSIYKVKMSQATICIWSNNNIHALCYLNRVSDIK